MLARGGDNLSRFVTAVSSCSDSRELSGLGISLSPRLEGREKLEVTCTKCGVFVFLLKLSDCYSWSKYRLFPLLAEKVKEV